VNNRSEVLAARNAVLKTLESKTQGKRRLNASRCAFNKALEEICPVIENLLTDHDATYVEVNRLQELAYHEINRAVAEALQEEIVNLLNLCQQMLAMRRGLIARFELIKTEDREAKADYVTRREAYDAANAHLAACIRADPMPHFSN
jgi:wyosine [tRNA(Phe)-imidazoG37] synthetase (radical SAM superfamily)